MSDLKFKATVDSKKGEVSLKQLDKGVTTVEKSTKKAGAGFKNLAVGVAAGVAAFAVASKALRGLIRWMGDAVDKAAIQQTAEKEVAAALESTGREVANNTEHFKKYASELQNATTFGDEQILSAQALMIQLTKLDREGLDMATKGAIGLASVYKTDLQAATTLVGKALAGNYGALSRYGIMVERTATDEEKRVSVLQQLQVMYQRAEAEVDTYSGTMDQLSNVYGDLKEKVGEAVTENETFRDIIKTTTEAVGDLIDSGFIDWFTDVAALAVKSYAPFELLSVSMQAMAAILKSEAEERKKASESMKEWFKHIQLNDELQQSLRDQIAEVIVITEGETEVIKENIEVLETQLTVVSGIRGELKLWGQELISLTDCLKNATAGFYELAETALPASRDFSDALALAVPGFEGYKKGMKEMTEAQQEFSAIAIGELMAMEAGLKGMVDAILGTFEKWALGAIVKSTMALPFPANLIASAVAMAAVKAIFAEIKGKEAGGWVGLQGPEIIKVGERGPEYVTSNSQITNIYNQPATQGRQRIIIQNKITIGEQTFYKETVKSVNLAGVKKDIIVPIAVVV